MMEKDEVMCGRLGRCTRHTQGGSEHASRKFKVQAAVYVTARLKEFLYCMKGVNAIKYVCISCGNHVGKNLMIIKS